jgi:hypothetical protein
MKSPSPVTTRILLPLLAVAALLAGAGPAAAAKRCCHVRYLDGKATVTGKILVPKTARILHVGMAPAVGTCRSNPRPGVVAVSKRFNLKRTIRGRYSFVVVYMHKDKVREKYSRKFFIRGKRKSR